MPNILPVTDQQTYQRILTAAEKDNHYVLMPTHYWVDDAGEVAGYFSNGPLQVCHFWMRSDSKPRLSYETVLACKDIAVQTNPMIAKFNRSMICCAKESPFNPTLTKHFNFKRMGATELFFVEH